MALACGLGGWKLAGRTDGVYGGGGRGAGPAFPEEDSDHTALCSLGPPPLPGCGHTLRGSCHLPLAFVVAFWISSTGLWFCLRERPGRAFLGLCKLRACSGSDGDPQLASSVTSRDMSHPPACGRARHPGNAPHNAPHSTHAWPSLCSHRSSHPPSENFILPHLSFTAHSAICVLTERKHAHLCFSLFSLHWLLVETHRTFS